MPSFLTNPSFGAFLSEIGDDILGGLGGLGTFASGLVDVAGPFIDIADQFGAFNRGPGQGGAGGVATNPATTQALIPALAGSSMDPTVNPADDLFAMVGNPNTPPGGTMFPAITPRRSSSGGRFPSLVQAMVPTPSGGSRVVTYRNMGRALVYSGDVAAVKRVRKVRGKLGKR